MNTFNILLIEDNELDAELIKETLFSSNIENVKIDWIYKKNQIKDYLSNNFYHIIVSDFNLVSFNAYDVLNVLKENNFQIPLICFTGEVGDEESANLIKSGANGYLLKSHLDELPKLITDIYNDFQNFLKIKKMQTKIYDNERKYSNLIKNLPIGLSDIRLK